MLRRLIAGKSDRNFEGVVALSGANHINALMARKLGRGRYNLAQPSFVSVFELGTDGVPDEDRATSVVMDADIVAVLVSTLFFVHVIDHILMGTAHPRRRSWVCKVILFLLRDEALHEVRVVRQVVGENATKALDVVPPVAVQLSGNGEPVHQLRSSRLHATPRAITGH